ncbi:hypothetical protein EU524_00195 [Candidatus Thorarchaeota archaeon]|nr:MAG: hypothetical protein EU524_00195 [Candidatus Thorarchaeota archaeon]
MKEPDEPDTDEAVLERFRHKERVRRYLWAVAELNSLIVDELRKSPGGLSFTAITERFHNYPPRQVRDALKSAIEDEYIERISKDSQEWYRAIPLEEP